jgi:hypothetical protein
VPIVQISNAHANQATVHLYTGCTYGTVEFRSGIAATLAPGLDESFVELPASALEQHE